MSCNNKIKIKCGAYTYSPCVKYEKDVPEWSELFEQGCLDIEQTTEDLYNSVSEIKESIDLSTLGNSCFNYNSPLEIKDVIKKHQDKICELQERIDDLESKGICDMLVNDCNLDLTGLQTSCSTPISTFTDLMNYILTQINP